MASRIQSFRRAFTLVELLIVMSVVSVLIALLLPAIGKARYSATFATCGANLRGVAQTATVYTNDNKSFFPNRLVNKDPSGQCFMLKLLGGSYTLGGDDRPLLKTYFNINRDFTCPFSPLGPLSRADSTGTQVGGSYELLFGYRVLNTRAATMLRVDDLITYNGDRFNILAADMDFYYGAANGRKAAHPDQAGALGLRRLDIPGGFDVNHYSAVSNVRGPMDRNFAYLDGSVRPLFGLGTQTSSEPRLKALPQTPGATTDVFFLPPMR